MTSLRAIHLVFIASSIVLTAMVTVWGVGMYVSDRSSIGHLAFAFGSAGTGVGLAVYLVAFVRKTRQIGMK